MSSSLADQVWSAIGRHDQPGLPAAARVDIFAAPEFQASGQADADFRQQAVAARYGDAVLRQAGIFGDEGLFGAACRYRLAASGGAERLRDGDRVIGAAEGFKIFGLGQPGAGAVLAPLAANEAGAGA